MYSVSLDVKRMTSFLTAAEREIVPKATASSLNKIAKKAQSLAIKTIAKDLGIAQKDVRKLLFIKRATWRNLESSIVPIKKSAQRISAIRAKSKPTNKGVSYIVAGRRVTKKGAFIAQVTAGNSGSYEHVFVRRGKRRTMKKGNYKGLKKQPIHKVLTVSVQHLFLKKIIRKSVYAVAGEMWDRIFPHEVEFYLKKSGYA